MEHISHSWKNVSKNKTKNLEIQIFGANNGLGIVGNGHDKATPKLPGRYEAGYAATPA